MNVYFKDYKLKTGLAIFLKFVEACFELLLPLLMVSLINEGIVRQNQTHVYKISLLMVVLTVLGYLASITCQYYASVIAQRVGGRIRYSIVNHILSLNETQKHHFDKASLINRCSGDIDRVQDMIAKIIRLAVRAPMIILGSVGAMYLLNPQLGLMLLTSIPVFVIVIGLFMALSLKYHTQVQKQWDYFSFKIREYLNGVRVIFAFNKAKDEADDLKEENHVLGDDLRRMANLNSFSSPFIAFIMNVLLVFLVYVGAVKVQAGTMNQSQILALINYCTQIVLTLIVFMNLVMIFSRGFGSWRRIKEILDIQVEEQDGLAISQDRFELEFENVFFSYPDEKRHILKDISFRLEDGQTLGIIGLTGSGKSTLLKLIADIYPSSSGKIIINDQSIEQYSYESLRKNIAYVAQKPQFMTSTLKEAVSLDPNVDVAHYLKLAEGEDILNKGLDAPVLKGANNFSGGQRQRISIARQWAKEPQVFLFDDSFSALDSLTQKNLKENLVNHGNRTCVIVSQRTQAIIDADLILLLDQGEIKAKGTHEELLEKSDLYRTIHALDKIEVAS